jgi:hypothetical protein
MNFFFINCRLFKINPYKLMENKKKRNKKAWSINRGKKYIHKNYP